MAEPAEVVKTVEVVEEVVKTEAPAVEELPAEEPEVQPTAAEQSAEPTPLPTAAVQPTQPPVISQPTPTAQPLPTEAEPTPAALVEERLVELEWPPVMRLGDSDVIRLSLIPSQEGYTITTDFPNHQVDMQDITIPRPGGYDLSAVARLDGVGFSLSPTNEQESALPPGETITWRWTVAPNAPGQQRLTISLKLRWLPQPGTPATVRESLAFSRGLDVRVQSFFGLSRAQAMSGGMFGLFLGSGIFLLGVVRLPARPAVPLTRILGINPSLVLEPRPGLTLNISESSLLRALFGRYARLALESEFLSGYSGARTFLALPVRPDGRADAYTIVKIGQQDSIEREFQNYETFVKDTLPPITARIQHPPVSVRGSTQAALQYTFIAEPGRMPVSLRQALLANPDPALLNKLFETFGPNWWMQRRAHTFRLAEEYDRVLPTHYVIKATQGRGTVLDGRNPPAALSLAAGDLVMLRGFSRFERRADGESLSLRGKPPAGSPPLRVRWLSMQNPEGTTGRVIAARSDLLNEFTAGMDRLGLPDPLQPLPDLLNERISGTLSTIHGDLNLENVLVGPGDFMWLIDFAMTRDGHPLYDFAHLEAELIAHVIAPQVGGAAEYLVALQAGIMDIGEPAAPAAMPLPQHYGLLSTLHSIAARCLFNPSQPREYYLALYMACIGALKFTNLGAQQKHLLYLTAAHLCQKL